MILYDELQPLSLAEFGIQIPISDSKTSQTFAFLKDHPVLGPRRHAWHRTPDQTAVTRQDLLRAHSSQYVDRLYSQQLEQELIRTYELIDAAGHYHRYDPAAASKPLMHLFERIRHRIAGTLQCCRLALAHGFCFYFGGGMHHAHQDHGAGFCLLNDIVIALRKLQAEGAIQRVWVIDVDAHKGDGTAAITQADASIVTLSIHMAHGWPLDGESIDEQGRANPAFVPSTIDIPVASGQEERYVAMLADGLKALDTFARPDLALVVCGADPFEEDALPSTRELKLTLGQMVQRDQLVYRFLKERAVAGAYLMAGGYGPNTWKVYTQFLEWALLDRLA